MTTGVGHNENKINGIMPAAPVDPLRMAFNPQIAAKFKDCVVSPLDCQTAMNTDPLSASKTDPPYAVAGK